jgi:cytochrome c-type biogenesis protein CcmH
MVLVGLVLLAPSLMRIRDGITGDQNQQNIQIARDRKRELKAELEKGLISNADYQDALEELEKSLLDDINTEGSNGETTRGGVPGKMTLAVLVVLVPLLGFGIYYQLGSPQYLQVSGPGTPVAPKVPAAGQSEKTPTVDEMIAGLKQKAAETPDDPNIWYLLGRLYASIENFPESVAAYEKLAEVSDRQPTALVVLADSIAMTRDGELSGRPMELIMEALEKDPQHVTALWMAGQAAADREDYLAAIDYWQRALPGLGESRDMQEQLNAMIAEAADLAKQAGLDVSGVLVPQKQPIADELSGTASEKTAGVKIPVTISVEDKLLGDIGESAVLFVFARPVEGPPMPVAALKMAATGFPKKLLIDDSSILQAGKTLGQYPQLELAARIAMGGQPMGQSGDLESDAIVVNTGADTDVVLNISKRRP